MVPMDELSGLIYLLLLSGALGFFGSCSAWTLEMLMQQRQLLERYGSWLEANSNKWWVKPIGYCSICTAFWASVAFGTVALVLGLTTWEIVPCSGLFGLFFIRRVMV